MSRDKIRKAILHLLQLAPDIDPEVAKLTIGFEDWVCFTIVPERRPALQKDLEEFASDLAWAIWEAGK